MTDPYVKNPNVEAALLRAREVREELARDLAHLAESHEPDCTLAHMMRIRITRDLVLIDRLESAVRAMTYIDDPAIRLDMSLYIAKVAAYSPTALGYVRALHDALDVPTPPHSKDGETPGTTLH